MALSSIPVPPDAARDAKARELVKGWRLWPVKTLKHDEGAFKRGDQFFVINGHDTSAVYCSCYDYQEAGNLCKHVRAVCLLDQQSVTRPAAWVAEQDRQREDDPGVELAFMALATSKRGDGAGVALIKTYESFDWGD